MAAGKWKWNANELSTHHNAQCTDLAVEGRGATRAPSRINSGPAARTLGN